jgi:hypothetical protein
MSADDAALLNALSADAVCERLHLTAFGDGSFRHHGTPEIILLPVGEILPWQKRTAPITIRHIAGAPIALTLSPNGYDAEAHYLKDGHAVEIAMACWHTGETLGHWSLIGLDNEAGTQAELAASDWFPTPMAKTEGEA